MRKLLVLVLSLSLIAAACGTDDDADDGPADEVDDASQVSEDAPADAADDGAVDDGAADDGAADSSAGDDGAAGDDDAAMAAPTGELRYGTPLGPLTMDPHLESRAFVMLYYHVIYDGLVNEMPDNSLVPGLATHWEISDTEARFFLREGVTFHDGTPFDAEAVKYNIEKVKATPGRNAGVLLQITEVEVVSPTEVVFHMAGTDRDLLNVLATFAGLMVSPGVAPQDVAAGVPAGTGPFMITERTESSLILDYNPDYWNPADQGVARITWTQLTDDEARFNALLTGEVDVAPLRAFQLGDAEAAGLEVAQAHNSYSMLIFFDIGGNLIPEFADIRVRQALAHAMSRDGWGASVVRGVGEPANQVFDEGSPWYIEGYEGYPYDPDRARELLAEAGVTDLTFETPSWGIFNVMNQTTSAMLSEVGVNMTIRDTQPGQHVAHIAAQEVGTGAYFLDSGHPDQVFQTYFAPPSIFNPWNVPVPSVLAHVEAAAAAPDEDGANAAYRAMLREAYDLAWIVPVWRNSNIIGYNPDRFDIQAWEGVTIGIGIRGLTPKS
ncbi:ABC transporter substrate-binding protein [Candidatus Poriferisodalis sp.]|uniref:ABC transporter substrate-binding protein n=1 Tax=Candidatus Poriferisodalis sp. TaxID=3101277 RepID=UPI003B0112DB